MAIRVLVTGAASQLSQTIKELFGSQKEVIWFDFVTKDQMDITVAPEVDRILSSGNYDYCINCAAYTNVELAEKEEEAAFAVNATGVKILAEKCREHHVVLIHISTDYVFNGKKRTPYKFDDTTDPINAYGRSKLKGEEYIRLNTSDYYIIRTSWLYSKKYGKNFYRTILDKANKGFDLKITDAQLGCPTNCENLANAIYEFIKRGDKPYGIYHFCDNVPMTWYDFALSILKENGYGDEVSVEKDNTYKSIAERPVYSVLATNLN